MLKRLKLENYRNHEKREFELADVTVIAGRNGTGKSNILESLTLLSFCRSYRESKRGDLILEGADFARITGDNFEVFISKVPQAVMKTKEAGVSCRVTDFVGRMPSVILSPETLQIITGSPQDRRRFLDIMLCQIDKEYMRALVDYTKVRRQRNHLLRRLRQGGGSLHELDYWDGQLVNFGEIIIQKRLSSLGFIAELVSPIYQKIADSSKAVLGIQYICLETDLRQAILQSRQRDIADERTHHGPHADDLSFTLNNRDMNKFASRGEVKSAILALKIAELHYLEEERK